MNELDRMWDAGTEVDQNWDPVGGGNTFDESGFQNWYQNWADKTGINPDPDDPLHKYDYRAAYSAGAEPQLADDGAYHWPSEHKADDHPNRFVDGMDTKTGTPAPMGGAGLVPDDLWEQGIDADQSFQPTGAAKAQQLEEMGTAGRLWEAGKAAGSQAITLFADILPGTIYRGLRGGDDELHETWLDRQISQNEAERERRRNLTPEEREVTAFRIPFTDIDVKFGDFEDIADNLGYSLGNAIAMAGTRAATGAVLSQIPYVGKVGQKIIAPTVGAVGATAFTARVSKDQFIDDLKKEWMKQHQGKLLTPELQQQWKEFYEQAASDATIYGLWEAVPETVSNMVGWGIVKMGSGKTAQMAVSGIKKRLTNKVGKMIAKKMGIPVAKLGAMWTEELITEMITTKKQSEIEHARGLRDKPLGWIEALKEVAPGVLLATPLMAAGFKGAQKVAEGASNLGVKEVSEDELVDLDDQRKPPPLPTAGAEEIAASPLVQKLKEDYSAGIVTDEDIAQMREGMDAKHPLYQALDTITGAEVAEGELQEEQLTEGQAKAEEALISAMRKQFPEGEIAAQVVGMPSSKDLQSVQSVGEALGVNIVVFRGEREADAFNGLYHEGTIFINENAERPYLTTLGHESWHKIETEHQDLAKQLIDSMKVEDLGFENYLNELNKSRVDKGLEEIGIDDALGMEELRADFVGEQFVRPEFWQKLSEKNPEAAKSLAQVVKDIIDKIRAYLQGQKAVPASAFKDLNGVQDALASVYTEFARREKGVVDETVQEVKTKKPSNVTKEAPSVTKEASNVTKEKPETKGPKPSLKEGGVKKVRPGLYRAKSGGVEYVVEKRPSDEYEKSKPWVLSEIVAGKTEPITRARTAKEAIAQIGMTPFPEKPDKSKFSVKSPEFKKWFKESKVVDETGKPLVVYHGTKDPYVTRFSHAMGGTGVVGAAKSGAFFFTSERDNAEYYADYTDLPDFSEYSEQEIDDLRESIQVYGEGNEWYNLVQDENGADIFNQGPFDTLDAAEEAAEKTLDGAGFTDQDPFVKEVYLSIQNPFETDDLKYRQADEIKKIKEKGYDGIIIRDVVDGLYESDIYIAFEPNQIKSSTGNVGTWDAGNEDIRFSLKGPDEDPVVIPEALEEFEDYEDAEPTYRGDELARAIKYLHALELKYSAYDYANPKDELVEKYQAETEDEINEKADEVIDVLNEVYDHWLERHESAEGWFNQFFDPDEELMLYSEPTMAFTDGEVGYIKAGNTWTVDVRDEVLKAVEEEHGMPGIPEDMDDVFEELEDYGEDVDDMRQQYEDGEIEEWDIKERLEQFRWEDYSYADKIIEPTSQSIGEALDANGWYSPIGQTIRQVLETKGYEAWRSNWGSELTDAEERIREQRDRLEGAESVREKMSAITWALNESHVYGTMSEHMDIWEKDLNEINELGDRIQKFEDILKDEYRFKPKQKEMPPLVQSSMFTRLGMTLPKFSVKQRKKFHEISKAMNAGFAPMPKRKKLTGGKRLGAVLKRIPEMTREQRQEAARIVYTDEFSADEKASLIEMIMEATDAIRMPSRGALVASVKRAKPRKVVAGFKSQAQISKEKLEKLQAKGDIDFEDQDVLNAVIALSDDKVSGFKEARVGDARMNTVVRAIEFVEQNEGVPAVYVEMDLKNLGGINSAFGHSEANKVFRTQADIVKKAMGALDADVDLFRHGGDEMSAVVVGADPATVDSAMTEAVDAIQRWASRTKAPAGKALTDIPHPKYKGDKSKAGVGIVFSTTEIHPGAVPEIVFQSADTVLEQRKVEGADEFLQQVREARTGASDRRQGPAERRAKEGAKEDRARDGAKARGVSEKQSKDKVGRFSVKKEDRPIRNYARIGRRRDDGKLMKDVEGRKARKMTKKEYREIKDRLKQEAETEAYFTSRNHPGNLAQRYSLKRSMIDDAEDRGLLNADGLRVADLAERWAEFDRLIKLGGAGRPQHNAYNINQQIKKIRGLRKKIEALEKESGVQILNNGKLRMHPMELKMVPSNVDTKFIKKGTLKPLYSGFFRTFINEYFDNMPNEERENFRKSIVKGVERTYKAGARGLVISGVGKSDDYRISSALRKANKTVAALNFNQQCPMFVIGGHGCYLDGCYVSGLAMNGQGVQFYRSAMYLGEILQLREDQIAMLNNVGGLRINGMGDTQKEDLDQWRDAVRHAHMRGLKLKIITKQDATMWIMDKLVKEGVPGARKIVIQPTVDPYWIEVKHDNLPGSAVDTLQIYKAAARGTQASLEAAADMYAEAGREARIFNGKLYRKYGYSWDRIKEISKKYPHLKIQPRLVVSTPLEIAESALKTPKAIQTWMHAALRPGMYSDIEGGTLGEDVEALNFDGRIRVDKINGEWRLLAQGPKGDIIGHEGYAFTKTEKFIKDNYTPRQADRIFRVLQGQLEQTPSALCCQIGASADACNDCTSHCHQGSWHTGKRLARIAEAGGKIITNVVKNATIYNPTWKASVKRSKWYSQAERVLDQKLPGSGSPANMRQAIEGYIRKGDVKAEEIEWSGVLDWIDEYQEMKELEWAEAQKAEGEFSKEEDELYTKYLEGILTHEESTKAIEDLRARTRKEAKKIKAKITKAEVLEYFRQNQTEIKDVLYEEEAAGDERILVEPVDFPSQGDYMGVDATEVEYQLEVLRDEYPDEDEDYLAQLAQERAEENAQYEYTDSEYGYRIIETMFMGTGEDYTVYDPDHNIIGNFDSWDEAEDHVENHALDRFGTWEIEDETHYSQYKLEGGKKYAELLMVLPDQRKAKIDRLINRVKERLGKPDLWTESVIPQMTPAELKEYEALVEQPRRKGRYESSHWQSDPNVLVHVRYDDRETYDGENMLFIEEIQSDWHQEGRKDGYASKPKIRRVGKVKVWTQKDFKKAHRSWPLDSMMDVQDTPIDLMKAATDEEQQRLTEAIVHNQGKLSDDAPVYTVVGDDGKIKIANMISRSLAEKEARKYEIVIDEETGAVAIGNMGTHIRFKSKKEARNWYWDKGPGAQMLPDAPFKKDWPLLAFKRMIRHAVDNNYDSVGWTTGGQQADRYNLRKFISALHWKVVGKNPEDNTFIYQINATRVDQDGRVEDFGTKTVDELVDLVGKEMADRIVQASGKGQVTRYHGRVNEYKATSNKETEEQAWAQLEKWKVNNKYTPHDKFDVNTVTLPAHGTIDGENLEIGGSGMKQFYDKILPNAVKRYFGKKAWGKPKLKPAKIYTDPNPRYLVVGRRSSEDPWGEYSRSYATEGTAKAEMTFLNKSEDGWEFKVIPDPDRLEEIWSMEITPEMREKVANEGLPLFSVKAGPIWYSQMADVLATKLPNRGTPEQFERTIRAFAAKGEFKEEELQWSGLEAWLDEQDAKAKVSRRDILTYLKSNSIRLQETQHAEAGKIFGYGINEVDRSEEWYVEQGDEEDEWFVMDDDGQIITRLPSLKEAEDYIDDAEFGYQVYDLDSSDVVQTFETRGGAEWFIENMGDGSQWWDSDNLREASEIIEQLEHDGYEVHAEPDIETGEPIPNRVTWDSGSKEVEFPMMLIEDDEIDAPDEDIAAMRRLDELIRMEGSRAASSAKYPSYVQPGGENYRELLLQMPEIITPDMMRSIMPMESTMVADGTDVELIVRGKVMNWRDAIREFLDDSEINADLRIKTLEKLREDVGNWRWKQFIKDNLVPQIRVAAGATSVGPDPFRVSHWDEDNVLAHVRFDERRDAEGVRTLHIAEIQSDWHQKGRKEGYRDESNQVFRIKFANGDTYNTFDTREEAEKVVESLNKDESWEPGLRGRFYVDKEAENAKGVPDAPFKKTWPILAIKRMVRFAAENGFDQITWDPGQVQADRYDLSTRISRIVWLEHASTLKAYNHSGEEVISEISTREKLPDYIGKEAADKLLSTEPNEFKYGPTQRKGVEYMLEGEDIKVGHKGMKGFYDKIMVKEVNKFFNKQAWGNAKVAVTKIDTTTTNQLTAKRRYVGPELTPEEIFALARTGNFNATVTGQLNGMAHDINAELTFQDAADRTSEATAEALGGRLEMVSSESEVWSLPITPEMKARALQQGMPMFSVKKMNPVAQDYLEALQAAYPAAFEPAPYDMAEDPFEDLDEEIRERMEAAKGIPMPRFVDWLKTQGKEIWWSARRHRPFLDPQDQAELANVLRIHQEVPENSKRRAMQVLQALVAGMKPKHYETFTMALVMDDMVKDIDSGLLSGKEELPFGFTEQQARAYRRRINEMVNSSPIVKDALRRRQAFQKKLKQALVRADLLPEAVLEDDRYFHHQVLEYRAAEALGEAYGGLGVSSRDVRLKRKGWQRARTGSVKDYNIDYAEAEFEVISQGLAQLETKATMDRIKGLVDETPGLKMQAKSLNIQHLYEEEAKRLTQTDQSGHIWTAAEVREQQDILSPFKQKMAMGLSWLGRLASKGDLGGGSQDFSDVIETLQEWQREIAIEKQEAKEDGRKPYPIPFPFDELGSRFWAFLNHVMREDLDGAPAAGTIFKAIRERNQFIKDYLGDKFLSAVDLKPADHVLWKPAPGSSWYKAWTMTDKLIQAVQEGEQVIGKAELEKAHQILARGKDVEWIVPADVAKTLDGYDIVLEDHKLSKASRAIMTGWKQWILINPFRVIKYNLNNMSGDLDIALAYDPKIALKYMPAAIKDLWSDFRLKKQSPELKAEIDRAYTLGVLGSGWSVQEVADVNKQLAFDKQMDALQGIKPNLIKRGWRSLSAYTSYRENMLRLASYRYFLDELRAGKEVYGASNKKEVDGIEDIEEKAAKLSRDLIGDYGNITHAGQWLRRHMIPFYAWMEVNAPRYVRLIRNLPHEDKGRGRLGGVIAAKVAWKATKLGLKMSAIYGLVTLWNHTFFGDEEDELGESQRRQLHLILGRRDDGSIITLRVQGALSDALAWFGGEDLPSDIGDVVKGKVSIWEKAKEAALAPVIKLIGGVRPDVKAFSELLGGRTFYPDPFNPRPIRDKLEQIARSFSLNGVYRWIAGKPKRGDTWSAQLANDILALGTYTSDPGESAYYDTLARVYDFMEKNGRERASGVPTTRSNALYYYKQALKYGDLKAAEKYLKKYYELGGIDTNITQSIKRAAPLAPLPADWRGLFLRSLTPDERARYDLAMRWYRRTYVQGQGKVSVDRSEIKRPPRIPVISQPAGGKKPLTLRQAAQQKRGAE